MGGTLHGVAWGDDNDMAIFFNETPDLVGVDVTLKKGERALTVRMTTAAWAILSDRYGGPFAGIRCQDVADEVSAAVVAELKQEISNARTSAGYYRDELQKVREQVTEAKDTERALNEARKQIEVEQQKGAAMLAEIYNLRERVKTLSPPIAVGSGRGFVLGD